MLTCVCSAIVTVDVPVDITVIQHPKESKHAKNTIRLAKLINPRINVISSEQKERIQRLIESVMGNGALIYPNANSLPLENAFNDANLQSQPLKHLIFIDASWKQAFGIWKQHSDLALLKSFHLDLNVGSKYQIRCAKKPNYLSSIEAIAYSLKTLCNTEPKPFFTILNKMQSFWPSRH